MMFAPLHILIAAQIIIATQQQQSSRQIVHRSSSDAFIRQKQPVYFERENYTLAYLKG